VARDVPPAVVSTESTTACSAQSLVPSPALSLPDNGRFAAVPIGHDSSLRRLDLHFAAALALVHAVVLSNSSWEWALAWRQLGVPKVYCVALTPMAELALAALCQGLVGLVGSPPSVSIAPPRGVLHFSLGMSHTRRKCGFVLFGSLAHLPYGLFFRRHVAPSSSLFRCGVGSLCRLFGRRSGMLRWEALRRPGFTWLGTGTKG